MKAVIVAETAFQLLCIAPGHDLLGAPVPEALLGFELFLRLLKLTVRGHQQRGLLLIEHESHPLHAHGLATSFDRSGGMEPLLGVMPARGTGRNAAGVRAEIEANRLNQIEDLCGGVSLQRCRCQTTAVAACRGDGAGNVQVPGLQIPEP